MERMMYEEDADSVSDLNRSRLTLDIDKPEKGRGKRRSDVGLLQLTSPEVERIFLDAPVVRPMTNNATSATTALPMTTSVAAAFYQTPLGPKSATQEQLDFGRGFDCALEQIRMGQTRQKQSHFSSQVLPVSVTTLSSREDSPEPCTYTLLTPLKKSPYQPRPEPQVAAKASYPSTQWIRTDGSPPILPVAVQPGVSYLPDTIQRLKEEPQLVPCLGSTPPLSPINMDDQDRIRQERKRERNRVAARKCRTKKLEQIMLLEGRVKELKDQNHHLEETANTLRGHMSQLQTLMTQHINCGCHLQAALSAS